MAAGGFAFVAKERARLLFGESDHLRRFGHRFWKLQLAGVNALQVFDPPGARGRPAIRWSSKRAQMDVIDAFLRERIT